jgi:hypothetical protein
MGMGDNIKIVWAEFSTFTYSSPELHGRRVENSTKLSSFQLKFEQDELINFFVKR